MNNNDQRMVRMMVEMTRFFCGDEKARQIEGLTQRLATEEDWQEMRIRQMQDVWTAPMLELSRRLTAHGSMDSIEAIMRWVVVRGKRDFWGGVLHYVTGPAKPTYKNRTDLALHFAFGAWLEFTMGLGDEAAVWKEELDRVFGFGQYDEADIQATMDGARLARQNAEVRDGGGDA